jgi:hypothetical protein
MTQPSASSHLRIASCAISLHQHYLPLLQRRLLAVTSLIASISFYILILQTTGCSAVGFGVGAVVDGRAPARDSLSALELIRVKRWESVELTTRADSTFSARLFEVDRSQPDTSAWTVVLWDRDDDRVLKFPLRDVRTISVSHARNGKWYGLGVGLVIDCAFTTIALTSMDLRIGGGGL